MPVLFVLFQSVGILWADSSRTVPWILVGAILLVAAGCAVRLRRAVLNRVPARRWDAWLMLGLLAFLIGFFSHAERLADAARDAERLDAMDPTADHLVDAFVESRRAGRFGDRVRLRSLRSVATGEELVARAELRLMPAVKCDYGQGQGDGGDCHGDGESGKGDGDGKNGERGESGEASRAERLLQPGASVRLGVRLSRAFSPRNPGSPDWDRQRARSGLVARARLVDADWVLERVETELGPGSLQNVLEERRRVWQRSRTKALAGVSAGEGLARALVLGDRSGLTERSRNAFRETGLGHLLAVSGLHVGFVAGFAAWLSRRAGPRLRLPCLPNGLGNPFTVPIWTGTIVAAIYAWMTGAAVSVARASLLLGLFVLARQGARSVKPIPALACVAAGLLWINPASLFDLGARFSFTACLALAASGLWGESERLEKRDQAPRGESGGSKLLAAARASGAASLAVSFGTLPWVAQLQGPLHPLSPFLNLLAIPWTGVLVLPTAMLGVMGAGLLPGHWVAALLWPAAALASAVEWFAESVPAPPPQLGISFVWVGICAVLGMLLVRRGALAAALLLWWMVAIVGVMPWVGSHFETSARRAVFFDVGQGDAALIQSESSTWLMDTGPGPQDGSGGAALVRGLYVLGVRHIDVLVVTHADLDHRAGAQRVLEKFSVSALWLPATEREEASLRALEKVARQRGTRVRRILAGATPEFNDPFLEAEVLWPRQVSEGASRNESSIVMRFRFAESGPSLLMMADVGHATERALLEAPEQLRADVLKVGHHGSTGSSGDAFLAAVAPRWAILSSPCEPTRGLPSRSVVDRLRAAGSRLAWTGRDGAIALDFGATREDPGGIQVRPWASRRSCLGEDGESPTTVN